MVDVFISYKREERQRCERIAKKLKALDLDVWFDARLPSGKSFDREIETTIKAAKAVLVLWSPASVESEWVRNEASIGKARGVLAAAQLAPCDLPIAFHSTHYETLYEEGFGDDHPGWIKVLERIGQLTGRPGIAGYSKALGEGAAPLLRWARANAADPLALKMEKLAERLSAPDADAAGVTVRKGAGPIVLLATGLVFAAIAGAFAWLAKPAPPPPERTAREVASSLVGSWGLANLERSIGCAAEARMEIKLGGEGLIVGGAVEPLRTLEGGWLATTGAAGVTQYRREGEKLQFRVSGAPDTLEYSLCG